MPRRIKKAKITHISLVPKGANRMPVIYKADEDMVEFDLLTKMDEQGELLAVVYAPENLDAHGDIASADVIKEAMYESARDGVEIDIRHDGKAVEKDRAYIAESFIIQKGDPRFDGFTDYEGNPVDTAGAWGVVVKIEDPELRKQYREGKWNGVSMAGHAVVAAEKQMTPQDIADAVAKRLDRNNEDIHMTKDEMAELLKEHTASLVAALTKSQGGAETEGDASTDYKDSEPLFKGDITDVKAVKAHAEALRKYRLAKSVDMSDPESVEAYLKSLEPAGESDTEASTAEGADETVARLERELNEARRASRVRKEDAAPKADASMVYGIDLSKEDRDAIAAGAEIAAFANSLRGYSN